MFGYFIMTYISYVTVQYYHVKYLDEHGNTCSVEANIWMIVANILISQIYTTHPFFVVIHNSWYTYMNLTLFPPDFFHVSLVLLVHSCHLLRNFDTSITVWTVVTKNTSPLSIHMRSKVPNESTLQNISLKFIWLLSISLTFWPGHPEKTLHCLELLS